MKRTRLTRKTMLRSRSKLKTTKPMKSGPRRLTPHEKAWQAAVLSLRFCTNCGKYGVQWAHRNEGKGAGIKTSPDQSAALCPECHHEIDNGKQLSLFERRSIMDVCIERTHTRLRALGRYPSPEKLDE